MTETWVDITLAFQEQLIREEMESFRKHIGYAEESLLITIQVNREDSESMDSAIMPKIQRFRNYLDKLREALQQLQDTVNSSYKIQ